MNLTTKNLKVFPYFGGTLDMKTLTETNYTNSFKYSGLGSYCKDDDSFKPTYSNGNIYINEGFCVIHGYCVELKNEPEQYVIEDVYLDINKKLYVKLYFNDTATTGGKQVLKPITQSGQAWEVNGIKIEYGTDYNIEDCFLLANTKSDESNLIDMRIQSPLNKIVSTQVGASGFNSREKIIELTPTALNLYCNEEINLVTDNGYSLKIKDNAELTTSSLSFTVNSFNVSNVFQYNKGEYLGKVAIGNSARDTHLLGSSLYALAYSKLKLSSPHIYFNVENNVNAFDITKNTFNLETIETRISGDDTNNVLTLGVLTNNSYDTMLELNKGTSRFKSLCNTTAFEYEALYGLTKINVGQLKTECTGAFELSAIGANIKLYKNNDKKQLDIKDFDNISTKSTETKIDTTRLLIGKTINGSWVDKVSLIDNVANDTLWLRNIHQVLTNYVGQILLYPGELGLGSSEKDYVGIQGGRVRSYSNGDVWFERTALTGDVGIGFSGEGYVMLKGRNNQSSTIGIVTDVMGRLDILKTIYDDEAVTYNESMKALSVQPKNLYLKPENILHLKAKSILIAPTDFVNDLKTIQLFSLDNGVDNKPKCTLSLSKNGCFYMQKKQNGATSDIAITETGRIQVSGRYGAGNSSTTITDVVGDLLKLEKVEYDYISKKLTITPNSLCLMAAPTSGSDEKKIYLFGDNLTFLQGTYNSQGSYGLNINTGGNLLVGAQKNLNITGTQQVRIQGNNLQIRPSDNFIHLFKPVDNKEAYLTYTVDSKGKKYINFENYLSNTTIRSHNGYTAILSEKETFIGGDEILRLQASPANSNVIQVLKPVKPNSTDTENCFYIKQREATSGFCNGSIELRFTQNDVSNPKFASIRFHQDDNDNKHYIAMYDNERAIVGDVIGKLLRVNEPTNTTLSYNDAVNGETTYNWNVVKNTYNDNIELVCPMLQITTDANGLIKLPIQNITSEMFETVRDNLEKIAVFVQPRGENHGAKVVYSDVQINNRRLTLVVKTDATRATECKFSVKLHYFK